ncbi:MAG: hypothetical protein ACXVBE_18140, partial [Bdellovibrionota bacterium]
MKYLALIILLASCAAAPLSQEEKAKFDHYAVVSMLGERLPVQFVGTTIFQNKDSGAEVPGWKLEARIQKGIQAALASTGKKMVPIEIDHTVLEELRASSDTTAKRLTGSLDKEWMAYVFGQAKKAGAKYLFLARPIIGHDNFPSFPPGFGLYCRSSFAASGNLQSYLLMTISLWRVEDQKWIYGHGSDPADAAEFTGKPCADFAKMDN